MPRRQRRSEPNPTEGWDLGTRVRVNKPGHMLHEMTGEVVDMESHLLQIRFDQVTEAMKHYEDTRKGLAMLEPKEVERL